jgi:tetrachlorobenzoquinone reductase
VKLSASGAKSEVPADRTVLKAPREEKIDARGSCESGNCGTCQPYLLAGDRGHYDMALTEDERAGAT